MTSILSRLKNFTRARRGVLFQSGFTIIELIIALAIVIMLMSVTLFNYNSLNKRLTLDTLAHQVAQWVRQTQVSAMSVKRHVDPASKYKFPGYGLHFDRTTPSQFIFFADLDGDNRYTAGGNCGDPTAECEQVIKLMQGNFVKKICGETSLVNASNAQCPLPLDNAENFDIVFTRPDPDADITGDYIVGTKTTYSRAQITLSSPTGYTRMVEVWTTGQVSVQ